MPWTDAVLPFLELQRRIGRKTVGKKLLAEVPCVFFAYDCIERDGQGIREQPMHARRLILEQLVNAVAAQASTALVKRLLLSETASIESWQSCLTTHLDNRSELAISVVVGNHDKPATRERVDQRVKWYSHPLFKTSFVLMHELTEGFRG